MGHRGPYVKPTAYKSVRRPFEMAAAKRVKAKKGKKTNRRKAAPMGQLSLGLTEAEAHYARLLADPCSAPLVHGLWPGSNGSVLQRFETDFIPAPNGAGDATTTAYAFVYVPATNTAFQLTTVAGTGAVADGTPGVFKRAAAAEAASSVFNNFGHTRAVACCAQVYWPGSESTRSGVVSMGIIPAAALFRTLWTTDGGAGADAVTAAQLRSNCVLTERMPQNKMEIKWFPGSGDAFSFNYQQKVANAGTSIPDNMQGRNAILIVASGFPAGVFPRIRIVNAMEWTGSTNLATGSVIAAIPEQRRGSVEKVLHFLASKHGSWYLQQAGEAIVAGLSTTMVRYAQRRAPIAGRIEL